MSTDDFLAHIAAYLETIDNHMAAMTKMREDRLISEDVFNEEMAKCASIIDLINSVADDLRRLQ